MPELNEILDAVKRIRGTAPKRNFKQSFDIAVSLKELDLKKPENKIKDEVVLPHGRGKPVKIGAIAEGELSESVKKAGIKTILGKADLQRLASNKKEAKKVINSVDLFIAQPDLMAEVGKTLGSILGPRDKMPKPVPPKGDLTPLLAKYSKVTNIRVKDQPLIHSFVGTEDMTDQQIAENAEAILNAVKKKLPKGESQIRCSFLKMTMSPPVKIGSPIAEKGIETAKAGVKIVKAGVKIVKAGVAKPAAVVAESASKKDVESLSKKEAHSLSKREMQK